MSLFPKQPREFRVHYYYLWVDEADGTEFAYANPPPDRPSILVEIEDGWEYAHMGNREHHEETAHYFFPVRPRGADWERVPHDSDNYSTWKRKCL